MQAQLPGINNLVVKGEQVALEKGIADAPVVGVYFSAHWCPPCRGFTPVLAKFYNEANKEKKTIEIIFVSSDQDEDSFKAYHGEMPWAAAAWGEDRNTVKSKHGIRGIPAFKVFKADGTVVHENARGEVMEAVDAGNAADVADSWA